MSLMLDAAARVSLIVLAALGVAAVLSRRSAALRHWILTVGVACAAATPLLQVALPRWSVVPAALTAEAGRGSRPPGVDTAFAIRLPTRPPDAAAPHEPRSTT